VDGSTKRQRSGDKKAEVARQKGRGFGGFVVSDFILEEAQPMIGNSPQVAEKTPAQNAAKPFIKGPIDLEWVQRACQSNAAELAWYLHYKSGILGATACIQIRPSECSKFGLGDKARQRQVDRLENAGLITADKGNGRCPIVQIVCDD